MLEVVCRVLNVLVVEAKIDEDRDGGRDAVVDGVAEHGPVELVGGAACFPEGPCEFKRCKIVGSDMQDKCYQEGYIVVDLAFDRP